MDEVGPALGAVSSSARGGAGVPDGREEEVPVRTMISAGVKGETGQKAFA